MTRNLKAFMKQKKPMRKCGEDKCLLLSAWRDYQGTGICNCGEKYTQGKDVTGVSLNKHSITLTDVDSTLKLTATVSPVDAFDKRVIWSTSDETIATVNQEGLVTYVAMGEATITVTTVDGGFTDECSVVCTPEAILNYIDNGEDTLTADTCLTSETKGDIATTYPGGFHKEFIEGLIETEGEDAITFAKCFNEALEDVYTFEAYLTEEGETADTSADCDDLNTNIDTLIFEYLPYLGLIDAKYLGLSGTDLINDTLISAYLEAVVEKYSN